MLKTLVKVGSISNLSDARYCAGMGVSLLGFDFNTENPDYVTPQQFKEILAWVSGIRSIGECNELTVNDIQNVIKNCPVDFLEINYFQSELSALAIPLIFRAFWEEKTGKQGLEKLFEHFSEIKSYITYFLIESDARAIEPEIFELFKQKTEQFPLFLGFGISEANNEVLLSDTQIVGIALRSKTEEKIGYTNADALAEILEKLEI